MFKRGENEKKKGEKNDKWKKQGDKNRDEFKIAQHFLQAYQAPRRRKPFP